MNLDKQVFERHAEVCKAMANPIRLQIITVLRDGERSVGEIVRALGISQANASQHLSVLRNRRIVKTRKEGATVYYDIVNPKIVQACELFREVLLDQIAEAERLAKAAGRKER